MPRALGVIPARGGSKRVPRKNIRPVNGKPLIAYTIEAAQNASALDSFVVSTEDEEIRDVALRYGSYVLRRPDDLAADDTRSGLVLHHALEWMESENSAFDFVVCLHPTSPIRDPEHINEAIGCAVAYNAASVASCYCLPEKTHDNVFDEEGYACKGAHILNGSIYVIRRDFLLRHKVHVSAAPFPYFMDRRHSLDIDEEIDLKLAELFLNDNP